MPLSASTLPKFVSSELDGVMSPSEIELPDPEMSISGVVLLVTILSVLVLASLPLPATSVALLAPTLVMTVPSFGTLLTATL